MYDISNYDVMTLAGLVAAYVGIVKAIFVGTKYESLSSKLAPIGALVLAALFVLTPDVVRNAITTVSIVGLTAAGAYHFVKNK